MGLSAVCAYNLSAAEAVFSRGKYMQSATVEQSHTKWVRYSGPVPSPRPGAVSEGPAMLGLRLAAHRRASRSLSVSPWEQASPWDWAGRRALCPPPVSRPRHACDRCCCPNRSLLWLQGVFCGISCA